MLQEPDSTPSIALRSREDVARLQRAGRVVRMVLDALSATAESGITTAQLDGMAGEIIRANGATGLFRGYVQGNSPPFPADVCISLNDEVVHGIPGDRVLKSGDVLSIDVGISLDDWCSDAATTVLVGDDSIPADDERALAARRLIAETREMLAEGIERIRPGVRWSAISRWMEAESARRGFGVITEYVGHGIGRSLHEPPKAPAYATGFSGMDFELGEGMVLAIEPMLVLGLSEGWRPPGIEGRPAPANAVPTHVDADGWTVRTADGSICCHQEAVVAVRQGGCDVLTN